MLLFLVNLIEQIALGLYILIGVGLFWTWARWRAAGRFYRTTHFELERDVAHFKRLNALTVAALLIEAGLFVVGLQTVVAPTVRTQIEGAVVVDTVIVDRPIATFTPRPLEVLNIPTSSIDLDDELNPASQIRITPTPTFTPVGTILPNIPTPADCLTDNARLVIPANGMVVDRTLEVRGSADTDNFASFKIEIRGPSTGGVFATRESWTQPLDEVGRLTTFVPDEYAEGMYDFRLAVFDNTATMVASCTVMIEIRRAIPTPTLIGG